MGLLDPIRPFKFKDTSHSRLVQLQKRSDNDPIQDGQPAICATCRDKEAATRVEGVVVCAQCAVIALGLE